MSERPPHWPLDLEFLKNRYDFERAKQLYWGRLALLVVLTLTLALAVVYIDDQVRALMANQPTKPQSLTPVTSRTVAKPASRPSLPQNRIVKEGTSLRRDAVKR